jgi:(2Fe-2S) ferredoxin
MSYYRHHVFFCLNRREEGSPSCCNHNAEEMFNYAKVKAKALGLHGNGKIRINRAGCMGRCNEGPVLVIYPEAVWYTYANTADIDEILKSHLQQGKIVKRLKI